MISHIFILQFCHSCELFFTVFYFPMCLFLMSMCFCEYEIRCSKASYSVLQFHCRSAEEKRLYVLAIKEATKLSSQSSLSPRSPLSVSPRLRPAKDQNHNILPSKPNLLGGKMRHHDSKCSEASRTSWVKTRSRFSSDSESSNTSVGLDSGVGMEARYGTAAKKKVSNAF